jgi:hypothetical protein
MGGTAELVIFGGCSLMALFETMFLQNITIRKD